ncbi:MAG: YggS family pyridoxal phosphate-dependent enzyme [Bdellovibrionales bacterium]|nr:YggS family pyridoxal phosphate-dependent enzyme [Bdellovibrionales bacterium]
MISDALESIRRRMHAAAVRAGRDPTSVRLIAVSKGVPRAGVLEAYAAGHRLFGENYLREAKGKFNERLPAMELHLIGSLQRNKVQDSVGFFDLIHSVDRLSLAQSIQKYAERSAIRQPVLMQVNISSEESKSGIEPSAALEFAREIRNLPAVELRGLMCIGTWHAPDASAARRRAEFVAMRTLRDEIAQRLSCALPELSMGMSDDFEEAVEEGATYVRVGTAIFGPRSYGDSSAG